MAFQGGPTPAINNSGEIPEIQTEGLGFLTVGGEKKLKLLPSQWPKDNLPSSSSSLLSVTSKRGLVAAAGPDGIIVTSTESVRRAFDNPADDNKIITDFTPDLTIPLPRLSHVTFSSDGDFLVATAQQGGGLAVYDVDSLLKKDMNPSFQISTNQVGVRHLVPNPAYSQYIAIVLANGSLVLADLEKRELIDLPKSNGKILSENVCCAAWSVKGKQVVAGLNDGTAVLLKPEGGPALHTIPRAPFEFQGDYTVSSITWLGNDEFFFIYSPTSDNGGMDQDPIYSDVKTNKDRNSFSFSKFGFNPLYASMDVERTRPNYQFVARLRKWDPALDDMLIITASDSTEVGLATVASSPLAPDAIVNDYTQTQVDDSRRPQLPQSDDGSETVPIGIALDLSSKSKVKAPIPAAADEFEESPTPLPAYYVLNHQGLLSAWWVVYNESIRQGTEYPGLKESTAENIASSVGKSEPPQSTASTSPFGNPGLTTSAFGTTSTPAFGQSPFGATKPSGTPAFGQSTFGSASSTSTPAFGQPAFRGSSAFGKPAFGQTATPATSVTIGGSAFGKSTFGQPSPAGAGGSAFGTSAFGSTGALGNRGSVWGSTAASQKTDDKPAQSSFSSMAGKSPFSSFGGSSGQTSGFASLGQKPAQSPFGNLPTSNKGDSTQPSFGSTVTVDSSIGAGSTLPSWATTPANNGGSGFGQGSSFASTTKESDMSDADGEAERRERDEATPTPQAPPQQPKGLFGMSAGGFKLTSSFKSDGTAKDDLPKPAAPSNGSLFGGDFSSALGSKPSEPVTPSKQDSQPTQDTSTTPAFPPKTAIFGSTTPGLPSQTPAKSPPKPTETPAPVVKKEASIPVDAPLPPDPTTWKARKEAIPEDAPLPPDPATWKPPKKADDELPPLAGSPAIKVEAPDSDVPSSPLDDDEDDDGDISVEEQEDDEHEEQEPSPSDAARRPRGFKAGGWTLADSTNQSPRIPPAAPTPPVKSTESSRSRNKSRSPSRSSERPSIFQRPGAPKSVTAPLFGKSSTPSGFPKPNTIFPPQPTSRLQDNLRSPSPVRSASTSAIGMARQQPPPQRAPLASSVQPVPPKAPTPELEVTDLADDEDERIRQELASEIVPTRKLDPFIAHQDYTGSGTKTGIPGHIEMLYRDINSMVDTLGLNSRSLAAFTQFHSEPVRHNELTREDLDNVINAGDDDSWFDTWTVGDIYDLQALESELEQQLDSGKIQDVAEKLQQITRAQREKAKLFTKINEVRRSILNRKDADKTEALRLAPLQKDQADQQKALRNEYARLLAGLTEAEDALVLLRSQLASNSARNGHTKAVPTVDAVKKTINKMIVMTEKKNNDILILESQMRKLGLEPGSRPTSSSSRIQGTPRRSAKASRSVNGNSPFATPPTSRSKMSITELNRRAQTPEAEEDTPSKGFGLFYTPEGSPTQNSFGLKGEDMDDEDLAYLVDNAKRRAEIANKLKDTVQKRGRIVRRIAKAT